MGAPEWEWTVATAGEEETRALGRRLGELARPGDFLALTGPIGAGKTVFAQGVLAGLGVEAPLGSPSFTLVHEYAGRVRAAHADLYRLGPEAAREDLGLEELRDEGAVVLVEWAEHAPGLWPPDRLEVRLERPPGEAGRRRLTFVARGPRSVAWLRALAGGDGREGGC